MIFRGLIILISIFLLQNSVTGQRIENQTEIPYFSFGQGVGITAPDSLYNLNIRFRIQNRVGFTTLANRRLDIDETEARVRRLRLRLDGFFYDPRLTYVIQLSFTGGDISGFQPDGFPNIIRDAMIFYKASKRWTIGFGQTKLPGNRQRVNSSGDLQLIDRSIVNAVYNIDRDFGIQTSYKVFHTYEWLLLRAAITSGEGRNWISTPNGGLSYTLRSEFYPFGEFTSGGAYFEGDLLMETRPKVMIGIGYNLNDDIQRTGGQLGERLFETRDLSNLMADVIFKYKGWAFQGEYLKRIVNDPITRDITDPENVAIVFKGDGINLQGSKFFPSNWEFILRYSYVRPDSEIYSFVNRELEYTFGINRYIRGHRLKLQADFSLNRQIFASGLNEKRYIGRFQIELGI